MKRLFLVMGPPSSGTRLMTRILINLGCWGDGDHQQRMDHNPPPVEVKDIVFRRHLLHERVPTWMTPNDNILDWFERHGYEINLIAIHRDHEITIRSILAAPHAKDRAGAERWIQQSWLSIAETMEQWADNFEVVSYESLLMGQRLFIRNFAIKWDLTLDQKNLEFIQDGNLKYYKEDLK